MLWEITDYGSIRCSRRDPYQLFTHLPVLVGRESSQPAPDYGSARWPTQACTATHERNMVLRAPYRKLRGLNPCQRHVHVWRAYHITSLPISQRGEDHLSWTMSWLYCSW